MGKDTNELDTREEDKARTEKRLGELEQEENEKEEMKIEDMSLEELLRNHRHGVFPWDTEILARFSALEAENADLKRQVEGLKQAKKIPDDIKEFIRTATLEIQSHRSRTDKQKDNLFQRAYQLYVKYEVEQSDNLTKEGRHGS